MGTFFLEIGISSLVIEELCLLIEELSLVIEESSLVIATFSATSEAGGARLEALVLQLFLPKLGLYISFLITIPYSLTLHFAL